MHFVAIDASVLSIVAFVRKSKNDNNIDEMIYEIKLEIEKKNVRKMVGQAYTAYNRITQNLVPYRVGTWSFDLVFLLNGRRSQTTNSCVYTN